MIKQNDWFLINFSTYFLYFEEFYKAHKTNILPSYCLFQMHDGKTNMIPFCILPIGLGNAARASTRQQQRSQQSQSGPEFDSTATHSTTNT